MVFSFNFQVEEARGEKRKGEETVNSIQWKKAKELFITENHFLRISALESIEIFDLGPAEEHEGNGEHTVVEDKQNLHKGEMQEEVKQNGDMKKEVKQNGDMKKEVKQNGDKQEEVIESEFKVPLIPSLAKRPFKLADQEDEDEDEEQDEEGVEEKRETLNFINSETVVTNMRSKMYKGDLTPALDQQTDLVPGVYEGGLKIWECSEDLVRHLFKHHNQNLSGRRVLELGCGAGLPGVFAFTRGASVDFNDYNEDVLEEITIPNVLLNVPNGDQQMPTRFFSGDWGSLNGLLSGGDGVSENALRDDDKYDLILTAETIYNPDNHAKLIALFKNCLKSDGQILVASKTYYFGVGGGIRQFEALMFSQGFKVQVLDRFQDGVNREILSARFSHQ